MARVRRRAVLLLATGLVAAAALVSPAYAGGGGAGGVCYTDAPDLSQGWIAVMENCFSPQTVQAEAGDVLRWEVHGEIPHTVTFSDGPDSGVLGGSGFAVRFNSPGTYRYVCQFHPGMAGAIEVTGAPAGGPALEVVGDNGEVVESFDAAPQAAALPDIRRFSFELDPLTAAVLVLIAFPMSMGAALRLTTGARGLRPPHASRVRWRRPWYVEPKTDAPQTPAASTRRR